MAVETHATISLKNFMTEEKASLWLSVQAAKAHSISGEAIGEHRKVKGHC